MQFTFKLESGIEQLNYDTYESISFKPIYYYLKHFSNKWSSCNIYCDGQLLFVVRNYGTRTYISRYEHNKEILSCTLVDKQLSGFAFLYKGGMMRYILKYDHHNLDGTQLALKEGYNATAISGKLIKDKRSTEKGDRDILFAHEMVLALIKWR